SVEPADYNGISRIYEVDYEGSESIMRKTADRVKCELVRTDVVQAGRFYTQHSHTFHATTVEPGIFTATILVTKSANTNQPHVVGKDTGADEVRFCRERLTDSELIRLLVELQGQLN